MRRFNKFNPAEREDVGNGFDSERMSRGEYLQALRASRKSQHAPSSWDYPETMAARKAEEERCLAAMLAQKKEAK